MQDNAYTTHLTELAKSGARKICGSSKCFYDFACGHTNNTPKWPKVGTSQECPLARYEVTPSVDPRQWWEIPASEQEVTRDELFALCAMCPHAALKTVGSELVVERMSLEQFCSDCPVKGVEEAMDECSAEC